jgi:hypothetical protein
MMRALMTLAIATSVACTVGGTDRSDESAMFDQHIAPIFETDCGTSACHAAEGDLFDTLDPTYFVFPVDADGKITGRDRLDRAHTRAVEKLAAAGAEFASLIRKPLDESLGGQAHRGGSQYRTMSAANLEVLMDWADLARPPAEEPLPALAERYRTEIQPVLAEKRCMLSSCHGASASNLLIFDPGVLGDFDRASTLANYGKVNLHLNFETLDPMLSRLVRKTIPLSQGGIFHRGGNDFFDPSSGDADLLAILDFVTDARAELGDSERGSMTGMVFAATDPTPRALFDIAAWQPGGDIYSLVPAEPGGVVTNLSAAHHAGPADIRDPAVSYDGTRVAFAMRRDEADCLNLYVMNIDGTGLTQLTNDTGVVNGGIKVSNVEPLWGPDGRIYFVSTRAGEISSSSGYPLSNMWRIDANGSNLLRMSFAAGNEVSPSWRFAPHKGHAPEERTLDLTFTAARKVGDEMFAPLMRVPPDFHADYHPHFGTQNPVYRVFTSMTQMPDLREPLILADDSNRWEGGALAIIDRNLGPVISDGGTPSVVNYVDPLQKVAAIGDVVEHTGVSPDGYYRDPFSLPDGTIAVVHSPEAIDHADLLAAPDPALYRVELLDLPPNDVVIRSKTLLVDIPGKVETDPRPIYLRRLEHIGDPTDHLSNDADYGDMLNFDLAVALTVATQDSPSNMKAFDDMADTIRYVRLVEEVPRQVADFPQWPDTVANAISRGDHGVRRVIAEFPATGDRSVYVRVPAGVSFYVQALDDARMATSTFNQWFFVLPGEKLKQVTRREVWNTRCGACHGSRSGEPGDTVVTPDVLTQASRVEANYDAETRTDKAPVPYGLEPDARTEIDFERDIQPILSQRCASGGCHDGSVTPNLTDRAGAAGFSGAYEALTAPGTDSSNGFSYVDAISSSAKTSFLTEMLMKEDLAAPRTYASSNCNCGDLMSLSELSLVMRWMDLGASYRGIAPKTKPVLPTY